MTFRGGKPRFCLTTELKTRAKSLLRRFLTPYSDSNTTMGVQPVLHVKQLKIQVKWKSQEKKKHEH